MNKYEQSILESKHQEKYAFNEKKEKNKNNYLKKKSDCHTKNKDVNQKQSWQSN